MLCAGWCAVKRRSLAAFLVVIVASPVATAHPDPECQCDGDVVGRTGCHRFGDAWAAWLPSIVTEMGVAWRRTGFPATSGSSDSGARPVAGAGERQVDTVGSEMRMGVDLQSGVSILGHLDVGLARLDGLISTGVVLGWRTTQGRVLFGAEVLGGVRWFLFDAVYDATSETTAYAQSEAGLLLDARVRADVLIAPWLSVNAWVGSSVLDRGDVSAGVSIAVTTRMFRGR